MDVDQEWLTGKTQAPLVSFEGSRFFFHPQALEAYLKLAERATQEGWQLKIASSFRSFSQQLKIWNEKVLGARAIYLENGERINPSEYTPSELIFLILRFSALPGTSRHHWGTDLDLYEQTSCPSPDYRPLLTPQEVGPSGPFFAFHQWLSAQISAHQSEGFFRPYQFDRGGVAPELWHLSHGPSASKLQANWTFDFFQNFLQQQNPQDFLLLDTVRENQVEIYQRFCINVHPYY